MQEIIYQMVLAARFSEQFHKMDESGRKEAIQSVETAISSLRGSLVHTKRYMSLRYDSDLIIWASSGDPDPLLDLKTEISLGTGGYLHVTNVFLSLYEHSPYLAKGISLKETLTLEPLRYVIAYPMSKSPEWYQLAYEERKKIMAEHIGMAVSHPENKDIRSFTTYSYGLGDHEFLVLYETNSLEAWSHVAGKLREAEARKWIVSETPLIVGRYLPTFLDIR